MTSRVSKKYEIPNGWRELVKNEVIAADDKIWQWDQGPWAYVAGSCIGERYNRPCAGVERHWTIIREAREQHESESELTGRDSRAERFAKMDEADRRPEGT